MSWHESVEEMRKAFAKSSITKREVVEFLIDNHYEAMNGDIESMRRMHSKKKLVEIFEKRKSLRL